MVYTSHMYQDTIWMVYTIYIPYIYHGYTMDIPIRLGCTGYIPDIFIVYTTWYILSIYHEYTRNILCIFFVYHSYIPWIYIVYYVFILHPVAGVAEEGSTGNTGNHILTSPGRDITSTWQSTCIMMPGWCLIDHRSNIIRTAT